MKSITAWSTALLLFSIASTNYGQEVGPKEEQIPKKLKRLESSYLDKVQKATEPLQEKYLKDLKKLKEEYTRAGDLQKALAADSRIKAFQVAGTWRWKNLDKKLMMKFNSDGTFYAEGHSKPGFWEIKDGKLMFWGCSMDFTSGSWKGKRKPNNSDVSMAPLMPASSQP